VSDLSPQTLLEAVAELARAAGTIALEHFRPGIAVDTKTDGSPVTIADRQAEQFARAWISERFPTDGILGEEFGAERTRARRQWIIDPVDGTKSFVRGVPLWGTLVAVADGERILAGGAYYPAVNELAAAAAGCGCWWNDARCRVSTVGSLESATVLTTDERFRNRPGRRAAWGALAARASIARTWGDCYGYLLVATGRAEAMIDNHVRLWDAAAVQVITTEAGGVFTDWGGRPTAFGQSAIATNARLADEVRAILSSGSEPDTR
jgi:histidinol phosphatase-like enzyme (inositol monophosphatase family)